MAQVTLIDRAGNPQRAGVHGAQAEDLLWSAGVDCGRWAPRLDAVSSVPQLSYARELLALQRRFGTVMTQRRRVPAHRPWEEPAHVHVHDDVELRVVVQGVLRLSLGAMTLGGWLQVELSACEWVSVPPHLPHAAAPHPAHGVDLICLFTKPGGWRGRDLGVGPAPGLDPSAPGGPRLDAELLRQARRAQAQPALAA